MIALAMVLQTAALMVALFVLMDNSRTHSKREEAHDRDVEAIILNGRLERQALEDRLMVLCAPVRFSEYQAQKDDGPVGETSYVEDENLEPLQPLQPVQPKEAVGANNA